jgi:hypothetical protein
VPAVTAKSADTPTGARRRIQFQKRRLARRIAFSALRIEVLSSSVCIVEEADRLQQMAVPPPARGGQIAPTLEIEQDLADRPKPDPGRGVLRSVVPRTRHQPTRMEPCDPSSSGC